MSVTYSLACHDHKKTVWIGQGNMGRVPVIYYGDEVIMVTLTAFLNAHTGCQLEFNSDFHFSPLTEFTASDS